MKSELVTVWIELDANIMYSLNDAKIDEVGERGRGKGLVHGSD